MGSLSVVDVAPTAAEDPITEGTGLVKHVIVADVHHAPREVPSVPSIALPATAREVTLVPSNNLPAADLEVTPVPSNDLPAPAREVTPVPSIDFPAEDDLALLEAAEMFDIDDEMFDEMFDEGDEVFDIGGQVVLDVTSPETGVFLNVELPNQDVEPMELLGEVDDIDLMSTIEGPLEEGGEVDVIDEDPQAAVNENFVPDPSIVEAGKLAREKLKSNKMKAPKVPIQKELLQKEKEINANKKLADSIAKALEKAKLDAEKLALKKQKEADKLFFKNKKLNIQANTLRNYKGFGKKRPLSDNESSDASWVPSPSPPPEKVEIGQLKNLPGIPLKIYKHLKGIQPSYPPIYHLKGLRPKAHLK